MPDKNTGENTGKRWRERCGTKSCGERRFKEDHCWQGQLVRDASRTGTIHKVFPHRERAQPNAKTRPSNDTISVPTQFRRIPHVLSQKTCQSTTICPSWGPIHWQNIHRNLRPASCVVLQCQSWMRTKQQCEFVKKNSSHPNIFWRTMQMKHKDETVWTVELLARIHVGNTRNALALTRLWWGVFSMFLNPWSSFKRKFGARHTTRTLHQNCFRRRAKISQLFGGLMVVFPPAFPWKTHEKQSCLFGPQRILEFWNVTSNFHVSSMRLGKKDTRTSSPQRKMWPDMPSVTEHVTSDPNVDRNRVAGRRVLVFGCAHSLSGNTLWIVFVRDASHTTWPCLRWSFLKRRSPQHFLPHFSLHQMT